MLTPSTISSTRSTITQGAAIATISAHIGSGEEEEEEVEGDTVGRRKGDGEREEVGVVEGEEFSGEMMQGVL